MLSADLLERTKLQYQAQPHNGCCRCAEYCNEGAALLHLCFAGREGGSWAPTDDILVAYQCYILKISFNTATLLLVRVSIEKTLKPNCRVMGPLYTSAGAMFMKLLCHFLGGGGRYFAVVSSAAMYCILKTPSTWKFSQKTFHIWMWPKYPPLIPFMFHKITVNMAPSDNSLMMQMKHASHG